jgi:hypothetical protein
MPLEIIILNKEEEFDKELYTYLLELGLIKFCDEQEESEEIWFAE